MAMNKRVVRLKAYEKKQVEWAAGYVCAQLAAPLTAEMVALAAGISPYKFKAGFLLVYGQQFGDYVKEQRMKRACALLLETNAVVAWIGKQCGYKNEASFYRAFKEWTGQTPTDFRNR